MRLWSVPALHCRLSRLALRPYSLLLDIGADSDDFDAIDVPEVVAQVEFAEEEGDSEFGELGSIGGAEEGYGDIGAGFGQ